MPHIFLTKWKKSAHPYQDKRYIIQLKNHKGNDFIWIRESFLVLRNEVLKNAQIILLNNIPGFQSSGASA